MRDNSLAHPYSGSGTKKNQLSLLNASGTMQTLAYQPAARCTTALNLTMNLKGSCIVWFMGALSTYSKRLLSPVSHTLTRPFPLNATQHAITARRMGSPRVGMVLLTVLGQQNHTPRWGKPLICTPSIYKVPFS